MMGYGRATRYDLDSLKDPTSNAESSAEDYFIKL